jgi:hypothetical protein
MVGWQVLGDAVRSTYNLGVATRYPLVFAKPTPPPPPPPPPPLQVRENISGGGGSAMGPLSRK